MYTKQGLRAGRQRRRHSAGFKARVVRESRQPGVSLAAVALANGPNANTLRRWARQQETAIAEVKPKYLFTNRRTNRLKALVHDGIGIWLCARRLHRGRFVWPNADSGVHRTLTRAQFDALVLGLPWQRVGAEGVITVI